MNPVKQWAIATRLETIPLALASVGLGSALAAFAGAFDWRVAVLAMLTAALLQIVCNLANDYGDLVHGADPINDVKLPSAIQTGLVTLAQVRRALQWLVVTTLWCGIMLLYAAMLPPLAIGAFVLLGILAVVAAITYTLGNRPYGYQGWGDVAVFLFFGLVGVGGTFYLHTKQLSSVWLWPAISHGSLVVGVLNVNNIRDMATDVQVGKKTLAVRIGRKAALRYHWCLLAISMGAALVFLLLHARQPWHYKGFVLGFYWLVRHGMAVSRQAPDKLTKQLQNLVLLIIAFSCLWILMVTLQKKKKSDKNLFF